MEPRKHHRLKLERTLAVLDSEWTSGHPNTARMLSLAIIRLQPDGTADEHEWVFNPECAIEPGAAQVHGITQEMVQDKPLFRDQATQVQQILEDCDIGGYAVLNDLMVLQHELRLAGAAFTVEGINIVDAYRLWTVREPRKLKNAYEKFLGPLPDDTKLHDACDDTRITVDVIEAVLREGTVTNAHEETMGSLVDLGRRFRRNDNDVIVFAFGEHMDKPAIRHPGFLEWMLKKDFPEDSKRICRYLLDRVQQAREGQREPHAARQRR